MTTTGMLRVEFGFPHFFQNRKPVQNGHHQIEQDQRQGLPMDDLQCLMPIPRQEHTVAGKLGFDNPSMQLQQAWFIIDDQNGCPGRLLGFRVQKTVGSEHVCQGLGSNWFGQVLNFQQ